MEGGSKNEGVKGKKGGAGVRRMWVKRAGARGRGRRWREEVKTGIRGSEDESKGIVEKWIARGARGISRTLHEGDENERGRNGEGTCGRERKSRN